MSFVLGGLILCLFSIMRVGPIGIQQNSRSDELQATLQVAQSDRLILTKQAGTGSWDSQCCASSNVMPASQNDDVGNYLLVSILGAIAGNFFSSSSSILYLLNALFFLAGFLFLSSAVALRTGKSLATTWFTLSVLSALYSVATSSQFLGSLGRRMVFTNATDTYVQVDLFYGIHGSVTMLIASCWLFSQARNSSQQSDRASWQNSIAACVSLAILELFRSGSIIALAPFIFWTHRNPRPSIRRAFVIIVASFLLFRSLLLGLSLLRWLQTGINPLHGSTTHPLWHTLYLGLSFSLDGTHDSFGIQWSDNWLYDLVGQINPSAGILTNEYDQIVKSLYITTVLQDPIAVVVQYFSKFMIGLFLLLPEFVILFLLFLSLKIRRLGDRSQNFHSGYAFFVPLPAVLGLVLAIPAVTYVNLAAPLAQLCALELALRHFNRRCGVS